MTFPLKVKQLSYSTFKHVNTVFAFFVLLFPTARKQKKIISVFIIRKQKHGYVVGYARHY